MGCLFRPFFGAILTAVIVVGVVTLFFASQINSGAFVVNHDAPLLTLQVTAIAPGSVSLAATKDEPEDLRRDGTFGLVWPDGYAQIGAILDAHTDHVTRQFTPGRGILGVGSKVRIDSFAFDHDPSSRDIPYADVTYDSPLGAMPAWQIPGSGNTWAIFVHGKGSNRDEALRSLPSISSVGMPVLVIAYRNDLELPSSPDKRYGYGRDEWRDVAAAMDYAKGQGARRFVLIGSSMGGSIVMATMEQPEYASQVTGLILDAPVLDLQKTVEYRAGLKKLPTPLTFIGTRLAARIYKFDWSKLTYLKDAADLRVPVLLFHGDADKVVPVTTSDDFAQRRQDIVTYIRTEGAGHVRSWNKNPAAYESAVTDFLSGLR